jgi:Fe-S cluster biogenesis protein NfuA/nitrite reductase/ring-hydroxylating ferredoxin subunit
MDEINRRLTDEEFQGALGHLDALVQGFESLPIPEVREKVFEMLQVIDAVHREGLERLVSFLNEQEEEGAVERAAEDSVIRTLLVFYDLLPGDPFLQAEKALDTVRPYIHSHGGEVELLEVVDGTVHLRLSGACQGCAGSAITLQRGVEQALSAGMPGFQGIEVHEAPAEFGKATPGGLISFDEVQPVQPEARPKGLNAPVFKAVARLDDLAPGKTLPVAAEGRQALLANVDGEVYAVGVECPGTEIPLTFGELDGARLTCPWHGEVFDVRSGKCVEAAREEGQRIPVYPVAIVDGEIRLATNVAARPLLAFEE